MLTREQHSNIPIEVLRTVVTIAASGSFTKAAERLGLSQPGISAQIKKLHAMVGSPIFERTSAGVVLTEKGKLLLPLAQRLLAANDQILCLGGSLKEQQPIRLAVVDFYAPAFLKVLPRELRDRLHIYCDQNNAVAKGLHDGYFDVGCLLNPPNESGSLLQTWAEELTWVRSRDFVLSPGHPIPIIAWPGLLVDQVGISALQASGMPYRIAFEGRDRHLRHTAVSAGLGVMAIPRRVITSPLIEAREYYLPHLPNQTVGISASHDADLRRANDIRDLFAKVFDPQMAEAV